VDRSEASLAALRRVLRAAELDGREQAQAAGLTPVQLRVLHLVAERRGTTATAIARRLRVSQPTVTALLDRLAAHGMVERQRSEKDRRQTHIVPTARGQAALTATPATLEARYLRRFRALEPWEQSQLIAALERVADMLGADGPGEKR